MSDLALVPPPSRRELMLRLRERLDDLGLALRVLADGILGADAPIDLVTADRTGRVVLVLVSDQGDELRLVAQALAQRAWVAPRIRDWIKFAPQLSIRPDRGVGLVLIAPTFSPNAVAAASALGPQDVTLATYRCVRNGARVDVLLEALPPVPEEDWDSMAPAREPDGSARFRTGLTDADLGLSSAEEQELK